MKTITCSDCQGQISDYSLICVHCGKPHNPRRDYPVLFPPLISSKNRGMMFVDGENLAMRYAEILKKSGGQGHRHVHFLEDTYVWTHSLSYKCLGMGMIRKHFYTSMLGNEDVFAKVEDNLKGFFIEAPRVFKKTKTRASKMVDITLATEMLSHAMKKNIDYAILVAGDGDYIPLVEMVKAEGCRVFVWFIESGMSPGLKRAGDFFADIGQLLFKEEEPTVETRIVHK